MNQIKTKQRANTITYAYASYRRAAGLVLLKAVHLWVVCVTTKALAGKYNLRQCAMCTKASTLAFGVSRHRTCSPAG
jgi:hypothetical protein